MIFTNGTPFPSLPSLRKAIMHGTGGSLFAHAHGHRRTLAILVSGSSLCLCPDAAEKQGVGAL